MQHSVRIAALRVSGDRRSEVESKVGSRVLKICNTKLFANDVHFSCCVEWVDNPNSMAFEAIITVYYHYSSLETEKRHCDICKETHDLFYCNRQYNCNQCEFAAYKYRAEEKARAMKSGGRAALGVGKRNI